MSDYTQQVIDDLEIRKRILTAELDRLDNAIEMVRGLNGTAPAKAEAVEFADQRITPREAKAIATRQTQAMKPAPKPTPAPQPTKAVKSATAGGNVELLVNAMKALGKPVNARVAAEAAGLDAKRVGIMLATYAPQNRYFRRVAPGLYESLGERVVGTMAAVSRETPAPPKAPVTAKGEHKIEQYGSMKRCRACRATHKFEHEFSGTCPGELKF